MVSSQTRTKMGYSTNTVANLRIILHKPPLTKQKGGGGRRRQDAQRNAGFGALLLTRNKLEAVNSAGTRALLSFEAKE